MYSFSYQKAQSVDQACAALTRSDASRLLSGGMTLIPSLKHRLIQVDELIDITGLPGWRDIQVKGHHLWVGAGATHQSVSRHPDVRKFSIGLAELAGMIGDPQVRARGTLGGSVANNDPAADYPAAVLGLNATIKTQKREIAADDFFLGMFSTALASDEIIEGLSFTKPLQSAYAKFRHAATGYAMAGVFVAQISKDQWRVAVTGATDCVCRWDEAEAAAGSVPKDLRFVHDSVLDDIHAPSTYRAHLVNTLYAQAVSRLASI
jgi:carbon-monoxide dehydrogenase medium subunit